MQLFCFTFAGGTASFFNQLERECGSQIQFLKYEYPGHGTRYKEELCTDFENLIKDFYKYMLKHYTGGNYAIMGYSMGCICTLEMIHAIMDKKFDLPLPDYVFLAAHPPNKVINLCHCDKESSDEYVKERTLKFGGIPESLINNHSFWRMYLPLYRADYYMIDTYDFGKIKIKSEIPVLIFYSEADTPFKEMEVWKKYFTKKCDFVEYAGSHFFIKQFYKEIASEILKRIGDKNVI